jgi:hypothetical protein
MKPRAIRIDRSLRTKELLCKTTGYGVSGANLFAVVSLRYMKSLTSNLRRHSNNAGIPVYKLTGILGSQYRYSRIPEFIIH